MLPCLALQLHPNNRMDQKIWVRFFFGGGLSRCSLHHSATFAQPLSRCGHASKSGDLQYVGALKSRCQPPATEVVQSIDSATAARGPDRREASVAISGFLCGPFGRGLELMKYPNSQLGDSDTGSVHWLICGRARDRERCLNNVHFC